MKHFYKIWVGDAVSDFGTSAFLFVIPVLAVAYLGVSDAQLGVMMAIIGAAPGIFAAPLGVLADRLPAYKTMQFANISRFLLMISVVYLAFAEKMNVVFLVTVAFIISGLSVLYDCIITAVIPRIVLPSGLTKANSFTEASATVAYTGGEAAAGSIYAKFGAQWVMVLNAVSYVFSIIGVYLVKKDLGEAAFNSVKEHKIGVDTGRFVEDLADNIKILWRLQPLLIFTTSGFLFNLTIGFINTLLIPFALKDADLSVYILGFLSIPAVVLGVFSPVIVPKVEKTLGLWAGCFIAVCIAIAGVLIILASSMFEGYYAALFISLGLAVIDFTAIVSLVLTRSYRQKIVSDSKQSGVAGVIQAVTWVADPLAAILAGFLSSYVFGRHLTILFSVIFLIFGLLVMLRIRSQASNI